MTDDRQTSRPQRPHPAVQERMRKFDQLMNDWITAHPGAGDEAMWDDPEFVRQANIIDGRDPNYGLNEN
ncbi:hypothetical protein [Nonomuraea bangladeshensis]|uniref:hypothetical protein n=1 Tax=Nonomuraea bangladeshensis TaxID=404385 RepID=UPI003C2D7BEC